MTDATTTRVLIVEDEVITREHLERLLTNAGYRTLAVGDAAAADRARRYFRPHVAVVDLQLPDADDFNLTRELGERDRCGVIIVSGSGDR